MAARLVSTGEAARALGMDRRSLQRWAKDGLIEPDAVTPGGHMRWDVERLRTDLRRLADERREQAD
jgi:DNA-binding transcriptional MerR regulator